MMAQFVHCRPTDRREGVCAVSRYLVQPNQTFYSVWPTKNMVKNELVALRDEGFEVLQCSQNAGDLLLLGQS